MKPLLILKSPLSGKYYATRAYKHENNNKALITITGKKEDVTDQIKSYIEEEIAEKDRVMKMMAEAIKAARAQTPYHGKLNSMAHELYDKALSEYQKLEVNND